MIINEGYIKKGGQNLNPPSDRPPPPSSHKLAIPYMDMNVSVPESAKLPSKTIVTENTIMFEGFSYLNVASFMASLNTRQPELFLQIETTLSRLKHGMSTFNNKNTKSTENKNKKQIEDILYPWFLNRGYQINTFDEFAIKDKDNLYIHVFLRFSFNSDTFSVYYLGDKEEILIIDQWINESFESLGTIIETATDIDNTKNIIVFESNYITTKSINIAKQSFYPWLSVDLEYYFKAFMESNESVLVLYGVAGTGKSTFLRSLIVSGNYNTYLAYNKKVIESQMLIDTFYKSNHKILAYEDIDNHLGSRDSGNQLMSSLLNAADGVIRRKDKKIIFSTNLPTIDRIDPALLRVGRCFDILHFRELTPEEAAIAASDAGVPPKDWNSQSKWPLAKVLAKESPAQQTVNRFARKVGFL